MDDTGASHSTRPGNPKEIRPGVLVCPTPEDVARAAAWHFVDWAWQSIARYGKFAVALAGGNTPRAFYRRLATPEFRKQVDWPKVHLFWGDERTVLPEHTDSNYGMARRELLLHIPLPPANVHRMEAERTDIGRAAQEYENLLRHHLEMDSHGFPRFHLILLGLGNDGHTASLFPGVRKMRETSRWVSTPMVAKLNTRRMTLTMPVLNAAHRVVFLVTGEGKAEVLRDLLEKSCDPPLPSQLVQVPEGERIILADEAASGWLQKAQPVKEIRPKRDE